jgi:hypothetical protein
VGERIEFRPANTIVVDGTTPFHEALNWGASRVRRVPPTYHAPEHLRDLLLVLKESPVLGKPHQAWMITRIPEGA